MLFHVVDAGSAVIMTPATGVYKQVKLYERRNELFAAYGGGFIRLMDRNRTSNPKIKWEYVDVDYTKPIGICGGLRYSAPAHASH